MPTPSVVPALVLDFQSDGVQRTFESLARTLTVQGLPRGMEKAADILSADIDRRFTDGNLKPLKEKSVAARRSWSRRTGTQPVAGFTTPMRVTDATRLAETATQPGVIGSLFSQSGFEATLGSNFPWANRQNKERPTVVLTDELRAKVTTALNEDLQRVTADAQKDTL